MEGNEVEFCSRIFVFQHNCLQTTKNTKTTRFNFQPFFLASDHCQHPLGFMGFLLVWCIQYMSVRWISQMA
jgi:hypothetical protein